MILVSELRQWLEGFTAEQTVSIDEGGLILQDTEDRSHYIEVGGMPEDDQTDHVCGDECRANGCKGGA